MFAIFSFPNQIMKFLSVRIKNIQEALEKNKVLKNRKKLNKIISEKKFEELKNE